jgi:hypothetical protein
MSRTNRVAVLAAIALLLAATGTVIATRAPDIANQPSQQLQDDDDAPPTAEELAHAAERLADNGLSVTDEVLAELAGEYGIGGAVRIVAWSNGDAEAMRDIRDMRDGPGNDGSQMGWGQIAKKLGVSPGIGSIMGNGGGHGRDGAPGQNKEKDREEDAGN